MSECRHRRSRQMRREAVRSSESTARAAGGRRCCLGRTGKSERRAFGVATDRPALAWMDDLTAELAHTLDGGREVCDREVGQREAVAWPAAALVQPEHDPLVLGLPAAALLGVAVGERCLQQPLPEAL